MTKIKLCIGCGIEKEETKENFQWRNDNNCFRNECRICRGYKLRSEEIIKNSIAYMKCWCCGEEKELNKQNFQWRHDNKSFRKKCKICLKKDKQKYHKENKEEIHENKRQYYQENKEEIKENSREYYHENKKELNIKANERGKKRRQNDPIYRFMRNISGEVNRMLKGKKDRMRSKDILPFTEEEIIAHMKNEFKKHGNEWMNINNQGVYNKKTWDDDNKSTWRWQLDHIKPISDFDIQEPGDVAFRACWDLTNLRPLLAKQNIIDGATKIRHKSKRKPKKVPFDK